MRSPTPTFHLHNCVKWWSWFSGAVRNRPGHVLRRARYSFQLKQRDTGHDGRRHRDTAVTGPEPHTHRAAISQYPFTHTTRRSGFVSLPLAHQHISTLGRFRCCRAGHELLAMPRGQCMPCGAAASMSTRLSRASAPRAQGPRLSHGLAATGDEARVCGQTGGFVWSSTAASGSPEVTRSCACAGTDGLHVVTGTPRDGSACIRPAWPATATWRPLLARGAGRGVRPTDALDRWAACRRNGQRGATVGPGSAPA